MKKRKIKELFDIVTGFFQYIENPLWGERFSSLDMDIEMLTNQGERYVSPLVNHFVDEETEKISDEDKSRIANLIYAKYKENWQREYDVLDAEYNPIDNYNMIENETIDRDVANNGKGTTARTYTSDITTKGTGTDTNVRTGSEQNSINNTETRNLSTVDDGENTETYTDAKTGSRTTNHNVNGFGSNTAVPESSDSESASDNLTHTMSGTADNERTEKGTVGNQGTETTTYNQLTDTETRNLSDVTDRDDSENVTNTTNDTTEDDTVRQLTRRGNIGVTTSTQMLQEHANFWGNYNFIDRVIKDTLSMISLRIWEGER